MTTPPRPRLEGQPPTATGPRAAQPAALPTAVGEPTGAARQGVPSALRPDPHPGDGHTAHRDTCPLRNPQEGRAAA